MSDFSRSGAKRLSGVAAVMIALVSACSLSHTRFGGSWERAVIDDDLDIRGLEQMTLEADSSLEITNRLIMVYRDSDFVCESKFETRINGRWSSDGDRVIASLDTDSFVFDTVPGATFIRPVREPAVNVAEETLAAMRDDIVRNLEALYRGAYSANSILQIDRMKVVNDTVLSGFCGETPVTWHRL